MTLSVLDKPSGSYSSKSEFFLDEEGALYRRQNNGKHQLVIPKALIQDVIRENYDRKAKERHFKVDDLVFQYNPSVKPGLTKKFSRPWTGPYRITKRLSELNYEILGQN
jgi:hypothetical protein